MSRRAAYFPEGTIIECDCGKSAFRRHVRVHQQYADDRDRRVWFCPCDAWCEATQKSLDSWARNRGFASYKGYQFLRSVLAK